MTLTQVQFVLTQQSPLTSRKEAAPKYSSCSPFWLRTFRNCNEEPKLKLWAWSDIVLSGTKKGDWVRANSNLSYTSTQGAGHMHICNTCTYHATFPEAQELPTETQHDCMSEPALFSPNIEWNWNSQLLPRAHILCIIPAWMLPKQSLHR